MQYLTKISDKQSTNVIMLFLRTSNHFIKVFQKQTFHLTFTIYLRLRCWTEKKLQLHFFMSN